MPKLAADSSVKGKFTNGWALQSIGIYQSRQSFSVIDCSGPVGSLYYGVSNGITNPIVPLAPGFTPQSALTGQVGVKWIGAESIVLHYTCSAVGRSERRDPVERSLPGGLHYKAAQHLPAILAKTIGHVHRQNDATECANHAALQFRRVQREQYTEPGHSHRQRGAEPISQRVAGSGDITCSVMRLRRTQRDQWLLQLPLRARKRRQVDRHCTADADES